MESYKIPAKTRIGHVHLKVSDLQKSLDFYCGLLGFDKMLMYGGQAAFISAGGYHHHIGLNTWHSAGAPPAPEYAPGLYHTAILYAERKDLAEILQDKGYWLWKICNVIGTWFTAIRIKKSKHNFISP